MNTNIEKYHKKAMKKGDNPEVGRTLWVRCREEIMLAEIIEVWGKFCMNNEGKELPFEPAYLAFRGIWHTRCQLSINWIQKEDTDRDSHRWFFTLEEAIQNHVESLKIKILAEDQSLKVESIEVSISDKMQAIGVTVSSNIDYISDK